MDVTLWTWVVAICGLLLMTVLAPNTTRTRPATGRSSALIGRLSSVAALLPAYGNTIVQDPLGAPEQTASVTLLSSGQTPMLAQAPSMALVSGSTSSQSPPARQAAWAP